LQKERHKAAKKQSWLTKKRNLTMKKLILFNSRDGLFRMDADKIVYFEADGNYTRVVSMNQLKATLGCNLSQTEHALTAQLAEEARNFMRIGKRFVVNLDYVYNINIAKQCLILSDMKHFAFQLPISREALKKMKELMIIAKI